MSTWPVRTLEECNAIMGAPGMPWETEEKLIKGRLGRVFKNQAHSLRDFWEATRVHGDKEYIVYQHDRLTFTQSHVEVERIANFLRSRGVVKGDRVAIVMRNFPEWITTFWAIHSLGAVSVAVNAWSLPDALYHCLKLSGSKLAIVDHERSLLLAPLLKSLKESGCTEVYVVRTEKHNIPLGMHSFNAAVEGAKSMKKESVDIVDEDNCCIFFTSGTTGLPKGVHSTQRQYLTNTFLTAVSSTRALLRRGESIPAPDPTIARGLLLATPLFHVTGNQSFLASLTFAGGKIYIIHKWDIESAVKAVETEKLTVAGGVPFMVCQLIEKLGKNSTLASYTFGGGPAPELLPQLLADHAAPTVVASQAYGLTETNAIITSHAGEDYALRPGSCGLPSPVNDFQIMNMETGAILKAGEIGEICCRGPNIAEGYWQNPKATAESFSKDGWFKTGDVGYISEEGWVYILDRAKEIIIRGGENISTITVENAIYSHFKVRDCCVCPVKDDMFGELVSAFVTVKPQFAANPPTEAELIAHVAALLPKHAVPILIHVTDEVDIERNASGKVLKKEIKVRLGKIWEDKKSQRAKL